MQWSLSLLLLLGGCVNKNEQLIVSTDVDIPQTWQSTPSTEQATIGWLTQFADEKLNSYVRQALQNNYDLKASAEQLNSAIALARASYARLFPNIDGQLQRIRRKSIAISEDGSITDRYSTEYDVNLQVSWEIDIWNKLSDASKADYYTAQASRADYFAARLALAANVAKAWFNVIETHNQLELNNKQLTSLIEAVNIVENNFEAGLNNATDIYSARSDIESQKAQLARVKQNFNSNKRQFNLLLGRYPNTDLDITHHKLPEKINDIPAGIPASLLERRPDIISARYNWATKRFDQSVARKDRFPSLTITGQIGASNDSISRLLDTNDFLFSLIGGLTQPIFNHGRLKAIEQSTSAQTRQALANYANAILNAFFEVENFIGNESYLLEQYQTTSKASELAENAYQLTLDQYRRGLVDYVSVLTTQRQFFNADSTKIQLYNALIQNRIDIYLALGGDFFTEIKTDE